MRLRLPAHPAINLGLTPPGTTLNPSWRVPYAFADMQYRVADVGVPSDHSHKGTGTLCVNESIIHTVAHVSSTYIHSDI